MLVDIRVEKDGFEQRRVPRVPLVTERLLGRARRILRMKVESLPFLSAPEKEAYLSKAAVDLPTSRGETILGIDIVLERVKETGGHLENDTLRPAEPSSQERATP